MNVKLKLITEDSLKKIMEWRMMPEVTKYMYTDPILTITDQIQWYNKIRKDDTVKYWLINVKGLDIGVISISQIDRINRRCSWAYYIADSSFRGRGIGGVLECNVYDYVFDSLNLNKLCCEVFAFNEAVIKIHQKYGSEIEGVLKQHIYKNGEFYDVVKMAILKEKWYRIKNKYGYEKIDVEE